MDSAPHNEEAHRAKPPVFGTRGARGNSPGITCTETQSRNQRRVDGRAGSFWTDAYKHQGHTHGLSVVVSLGCGSVASHESIAIPKTAKASTGMVAEAMALLYVQERYSYLFLVCVMSG